jgi:chromosome partitioning protein
MHIIVLASQKGGSGKTTLSGHLAVEAEKSGAGPVALIDTDPQASLSHWWNARAASAPAFARISVEELEDGLDHLRQSGFRLAIIDTPPAITHSISEVVSHADLVLIPARPSPHDLRAVGATIDIAERHGKPLVFVMNAATARARITGEAAVALSQHGTVAPVTLHHRVDFAASMVDGKTIGEIDPKSRSAQEIGELWAYVAGRLARLTGAADIHRPLVESNLRSLSGLSPVAAEEEETDEHPAPLREAPHSFAVEPPPLPEIDLPPRGIPQSPTGIERRSGEERRKNPDGRPPAGMPDRRVGVFGRRNADRLPQPMPLHQGNVEKFR